MTSIFMVTSHDLITLFLEYGVVVSNAVGKKQNPMLNFGLDHFVCVVFPFLQL